MQRRVLAMKGTPSLQQQEQHAQALATAERGAAVSEAASKNERERRRVEREQQEKAEAAACLMRQHSCTDLFIRGYDSTSAVKWSASAMLRKSGGRLKRLRSALEKLRHGGSREVLD